MLRRGAFLVLAVCAALTVLAGPIVRLAPADRPADQWPSYGGGSWC